MNLFTATTLHESAPIGTQPWYSMVPLIQLNFPAGTLVDPTMTCGAFLQSIMTLEPTLRARILNMDIPEVSEQVEDAKRSGHKTMLVAIMVTILLATILIAGGYVATTSHTGGTPDAGVIEKFTNFMLEILKMLISLLSGQDPTT